MTYFNLSVWLTSLTLTAFPSSWCRKFCWTSITASLSNLHSIQGRTKAVKETLIFTHFTPLQAFTARTKRRCNLSGLHFGGFYLFSGEDCGHHTRREMFPNIRHSFFLPFPSTNRDSCFIPKMRPKFFDSVLANVAIKCLYCGFSSLETRTFSL